MDDIDYGLTAIQLIGEINTLTRELRERIITLDSFDVKASLTKYPDNKFYIETYKNDKQLTRQQLI